MVVHGKSDMVTKASDSVKFYNNAGSKQKVLKIIPDAYHEPMHDIEADVYYNIILDFLEAQYKNTKNFGISNS